MEYTRLTNLEVTGHLKVAGQEVTPSGGGGSSTLSGLTDVDISNPTDGQTLVYNATTGKWENGAGGGGGANVIPVFTLTKTSATDGTATCNMTLESVLNAIQSGNLCMAKFVTDMVGPIPIPDRYANLLDADSDQVTFGTPVLTGGGDIEWDIVEFDSNGGVFEQIVTTSYPGE